MHRAVNIWPFNGYFASKSITNPASAVAPTTPSYAAVSQAPSVTVQEQATFSYPACKSYTPPLTYPDAPANSVVSQASNASSQAKAKAEVKTDT